jgi:hypothetical protein
MYDKQPASKNGVKRRLLAGNQPSDSIKMGISWAAEQLLTTRLSKKGSVPWSQSFVVQRVQNLLTYSHFCEISMGESLGEGQKNVFRATYFPY